MTDSFKAIASDHEALRLRLIAVACPAMNPTRLDEKTRRLLVVITKLLETKQALVSIAGLAETVRSPIADKRAAAVQVAR